MSLILEWRQSAPYIHVTDVPAAVPEMELTLERWRIEDDDRISGFVMAEGTAFDRFEGELDDLPSVVDYSIISERASARLYQVRFRSKTQHLPEYSGVSGVISEITIEPDGFHITAHVPNREEVVNGYQFLESQDMDVEIVSLYEAQESSPTATMSDKQLEALFTAYDRGYFDVPKGATLTEVAEELDISPSSLSGRLKRAQQQLLETHLQNERVMEKLR